jgi:hypothetical protein
VEAREIQRALTTLIDFFETGNNESDAAAKAVLASDSNYEEYWSPEIEKFQKSIEWTGLRGPEAEILVSRLRQAAQLIGVEK